MKTILIFLISFTALGQYAPKPLDNIYSYVSIGSSSAVKPHTNQLILNGIVTAGVRYKLFDISLNTEYVNLDPKYLSYFFTVQVMPITIYEFELGLGIKKGNIIRMDNKTFDLVGVQGEIRYTLGKFFGSLVGNYDFRGDTSTMWGKDYMVYTTHLKIGIKI